MRDTPEPQPERPWALSCHPGLPTHEDLGHCSLSLLSLGTATGMAGDKHLSAGFCADFVVTFLVTTLPPPVHRHSTSILSAKVLLERDVPATLHLAFLRFVSGKGSRETD